MLRVHRRGFPRGDIEEPGVEMVYVVEKSSPFADGLAHGRRIRIVEPGGGPSIGRHFPDHATAIGQRLPETIEIGRAGETCSHADNGDVGGHGRRRCGCRDWVGCRNDGADVIGQGSNGPMREQHLDAKFQVEGSVDRIQEPHCQQRIQAQFGERCRGGEPFGRDAQCCCEQVLHAISWSRFDNRRLRRAPVQRLQLLCVGNHASPRCWRLRSTSPVGSGRLRAVISR